MFPVERREMDSSPDENEENHTNHNAFDDLIDSEEDEVREGDNSHIVDEYRMRRDPNYREWERRRRRSRASSSESDTDRIRHRSQYNPMLRAIRCPEVEVEELNSYTRQMIRMGELGDNSDDTERTSGCRGMSCHCSSSERDQSDDMA